MPKFRIAALPFVALIAIAMVVLAGACGSGERPELVAVDGADSGAGAPVLEVGAQVGGQSGVGTTPARSADGSSTRATIAPSTDPSDRLPLVVFDTDMGPDIDDALALAVLHAYQDDGRAEIAAVTLSRNSVTGARFIDAFNTWYGHPDIPIGIDRRSPYTLADNESYVALADRWPNDVADRSISDGVTVMRQVLATALADGRRPIVVQVGFSGNTAALIDSGPDEISPLTGAELVVETKALLSIMAGSIDNSRVEFNVANDVDAARRVLTGWPGDLLLSPFELGWDLHYPYAAIRDRLPNDSPLRVAYEFRDYDWHVDAPPLYDTRAWDLTSVMQAIEPDADWFPVSDWGNVTIDGQGRTGFDAGEGRHRMLLRSGMDGGQLARAQARMIELVSAQPG